MTKTTTLPPCYFQTRTPFDLVLFGCNQGNDKEPLAQVLDKMHEPILFVLGSNFEDHPDAQAKSQPDRFCILAL